MSTCYLCAISCGICYSFCDKAVDFSKVVGLSPDLYPPGATKDGPRKNIPKV